MVEIPLCNKCSVAADAIDVEKLTKRKITIFEAMTKYHNLHQMVGKVPDQMLEMAVERILEETLEKL